MLKNIISFVNKHVLVIWVIIKKMEEFQITNKKIIDVSDFLFSEYKIVA